VYLQVWDFLSKKNFSLIKGRLSLSAPPRKMSLPILGALLPPPPASGPARAHAQNFSLPFSTACHIRQTHAHRKEESHSQAGGEEERAGGGGGEGVHREHLLSQRGRKKGRRPY